VLTGIKGKSIPMPKKTTAAIALSGALLVSGAVGARILTTDGWLWAAAPTHAYGLITFVVMDLVLTVALWRGTRYAQAGAVTLALVQFLAMAGDLSGYSPSGVPSDVFRSYLLSNSAFVVLLAIQPAIAGLGLWSRKQTGTGGVSRNGQES
jgi:hypothetical protein